MLALCAVVVPMAVAFDAGSPARSSTAAFGIYEAGYGDMVTTDFAAAVKSQAAQSPGKVPVIRRVLAQMLAGLRAGSSVVVPGARSRQQALDEVQRALAAVGQSDPGAR